MANAAAQGFGKLLELGDWARTEGSLDVAYLRALGGSGTSLVRAP